MQPIYPSRRGISPYVIVLLAFAAFGLACLIMLVAAVTMIYGNVYSSGNILPGVKIGGNGIAPVDVGGMSTDKAAGVLQNALTPQTVTLRDGTRQWNLNSADLGISIDGAATAARAAQAGHDAGIAGGLRVMLSGRQVAPVFAVDLMKAQSALTSLSASTNVAPKYGNPPTSGRALDMGATLDGLRSNAESVLRAGALDLMMYNIAPPPQTSYVVQQGEELALIAKKFNVSMSDIVAMNNISDADFIYPGQTLLIPAAGIWNPTEADAPPAPVAQGKGIVVDVKAQRIYAYENGHLVHSALMSSGTAGHDTVQGDYHIYVKYQTTRMTGPGYDLPDVPWTMYFYQGYGIHGAYWHNSFGRPMSHGCVNLSIDEAKWFYDFASVGTLVRLIPA